MCIKRPARAESDGQVPQHRRKRDHAAEQAEACGESGARTATQRAHHFRGLTCTKDVK
jgi:hypothetical protein